jgi:predicted aminopeptidase
MFRKAFLGVGVLAFAALTWQFELISYGIGQLKGQLHIVMKARPVEEYLQNDTVADSLKQKLLLVQEIREYAISSLGVNDSENYTTLYDQKGKPVLWAVTGSEPYALKPKEWKFPFLGAFTYKGYFDHRKALQEEGKLKAEGYDTSVRTVGGWSTLGWFKDPILSNMLYRSEGDLANLIIHELTHATLYVKNDVDFNENLASFIGDKGAEAFLADKYGKDSKEFRAYIHSKEDYQLFSEHILNGAAELDTLYKTFPQDMPEEDKARQKKQLIKKIIAKADTLKLHQPERYEWFNEELELNNAYFMSFVRYRSKQNNFEKEFKEKFNEDLKAYLEYLKKTYPSM